MIFRTIYIFLILLSPAWAATLHVVEENGPRSKQLNMVFLSEGYTAGDMPAFNGHVTQILDYLFSKEPWRQYRSFFNIYRIEVTSNQSGTTNGTGGGSRDTYFESGFYTPSIPQLATLTGTGQSRIYTLLNEFVPEYDLNIVVINDPKYGGAGGPYTTVTTNVSSPQIAEHEFGHSFGGLSDEYDVEYTIYSPYETPNNTAQTSRSLIKWNYWIDDSTPLPTPETSTYNNTPGIFEGSMYRTVGWYRPHNASVMRYIGNPCGQINREQFVLKYYAQANPIFNFGPSQETRNISGPENLGFTVNMRALESAPPMLVTWKIDGVPQVGVTDSESTIFDLATTWKYLVPLNNAAPTGWNTTAFQDSSWLSGAAFIGLETGNSNLPDPGMGLPATPPNTSDQCVIYLRKRFQYNGTNASNATVRIDQVVDDGVTYYLNGTLLGSVRHTPGALLANAAVPPGGDVAGVELNAVVKAGNTGLQEGINVLCAEVHQVSTSSSDAVFGARLIISQGASFSTVSDALGNGNHTVSVTVQDPTAFVRRDPDGLLNETVTWPFTLSNQLPNTLGEWRTVYGSDTANPSRDGLVNMIKYALALNPNVTAMPSQVPYSGIWNEGAQYLTLTVPRRLRRTDVDYVIEVSDDLINWNSGHGYTVTLENQPTKLVVRDTQPFATSGKRFIRLKVRENNVPQPF